MSCSVGSALMARKQELARQWAERIHRSSPRYRARPLAELEAIATGVVEGLAEALDTGDYSHLETCMEQIAHLRAAMSFEAGEVQKALLLGGEVLFPAIEHACAGDAQKLVWAVSQAARALNRTATILDIRFSEASGAASGGESYASAASRRLEAILEGLGYAAVVVNRDLIATWGSVALQESMPQPCLPGSAHQCQAGPEACALALTASHGQLSRSDHPGCPVRIAIPVTGSDGQLVEIIGLVPR